MYSSANPSSVLLLLAIALLVSNLLFVVPSSSPRAHIAATASTPSQSLSGKVSQDLFRGLRGHIGNSYYHIIIL